MSNQEEEDAKKFVQEILQRIPEEPNFFDVKTNTVSPEWAIWYAANTKGDANHAFGMLTVKMLVLQAHLANMIQVYWDEENEVALKIIKNNPQLWGLLMTLQIRAVKPKRFQWLRNLFKRIKHGQ